MRPLGLLLIGAMFLGCGGEKPVSFREQVQPILQAKCTQCHAGEDAAGGIVLTSYEAVMNSRTVNGKKPLIVPQNLKDSWLYILAGTNQPHFRMPPDTSTITPLPKDELLTLSRWITEGAKNN